MTELSEPTLAERIEAIEQAYEFMLAYAAQGREDEDGGSIRQFLQRAAAALEGLGTAASASAQARNATGSREALAAFLEVFEEDARKARAALQLVLVQKSIGSQLVDNLNASIHLRALLTDVFLIDEALKRGEG
jgi:hypothetical protein